jgi:hypothetical protein
MNLKEYNKTPKKLIREAKKLFDSILQKYRNDVINKNKIIENFPD